MPDHDFWTRFWGIICEYQDLLKIATAIPVFLIVFSLLVSPAVQPGTDSYVIMMANFAMLVPLTLVLFYLVMRCGRREPPEQF